jgi:hypothetical protein
VREGPFPGSQGSDGPEDGSHDAAIAARSEARMVKKRIRASLTATERVRGAIDVRSLIP